MSERGFFYFEVGVTRLPKSQRLRKPTKRVPGFEGSSGFKGEWKTEDGGRKRTFMNWEGKSDWKGVTPNFRVEKSKEPAPDPRSESRIRGQRVEKHAPCDDTGSKSRKFEMSKRGEFGVR